MGDKGGRCVGP